MLTQKDMAQVLELLDADLPITKSEMVKVEIINYSLLAIVFTLAIINTLGITNIPTNWLFGVSILVITTSATISMCWLKSKMNSR